MEIPHAKIVFVTGGVCSSLGKGIAAASIAALLKAAGQRVSVQKLDPYLNVDPGTMSPFQHGEVFVTTDGAETDLDLGHYERFIGEPLTAASTMTTGRIYQSVLEAERSGNNLGATIQVVPHIVEAIQKSIATAAEQARGGVLVVEIGGTVGDIEGEPFLEAVRQLRKAMRPEDTACVHLTLLPFLAASKELKTKPTQLSVRDLRRSGIDPDIILARADMAIAPEHLEKISKLCGVPADAVLPAPTVSSIYEVPLIFEKHGIARVLSRVLNLRAASPNMRAWQDVARKSAAARTPLRIALCGKYNGLEDAYLSVLEALRSAAISQGFLLEVCWIDAGELEKDGADVRAALSHVAGVVIPGGFGNRGIEGKIAVAKFCRENDLPLLGLCLGSQILAVEFARNVAGMTDATSQEWDEHAAEPLVQFLPGQHAGRKKGGTMRLGAYPCAVARGTRAFEAYKKREVIERHRHRYEFNTAHQKRLEEAGLRFSGTSPTGELIEIVEVSENRFHLGTQFHPEFLSTPFAPHPLFAAFVRAAGQENSASS